MRRKSANAWAHGSPGPRLRGSLHPPPGLLKFSPLPEIPRAPSVRDFSPREISAKIRRQSGKANQRGQGAAGAQRKATKRCERAAGIESHGIDQKPERQESARTGDRCASALAFLFSPACDPAPVPVFILSSLPVSVTYHGGRVMSRSCRPACAEGLRWMRGVLT